MVRHQKRRTSRINRRNITEGGAARGAAPGAARGAAQRPLGRRWLSGGKGELLAAGSLNSESTSYRTLEFTFNKRVNRKSASYYVHIRDVNYILLPTKDKICAKIRI